MSTIKFTIDPANPPVTPLGDLERFDAIKDSEIDYSDIPEMDEIGFERITKIAKTIRYDQDMLTWFQSQGKGYQTKMNTVLRAFYEKHKDRPNT